jgi:hypothetical protein
MSSNAPYAAPEPPPLVDYEHLPDTGVRKILEARDERQHQWTRWGGVLAGLFITIGATILLSLLGLALGLSTLEPRSGDSLGGLGTGTAVWWGIQSLLTVFLGGYAAAKLGGTIRRADGVVAGILTWATSLLATLWLIGNIAAVAVMGAAGMPGAMPPSGMGRGEMVTTTQAAAGTAWYMFAITAGSLLAGMAGGALGSVGPVRRFAQLRPIAGERRAAS